MNYTFTLIFVALLINLLVILIGKNQYAWAAKEV
jgi:hypothetical protein